MKGLGNYKEIIFNQLFEMKVKYYKSPRDGKYCDTEVTCKNKSLNHYIRQTYNKYRGYSGAYSNFFNEAVLIAYKAIQKFEPLDGVNSYEGIVRGTDELNRNRLINYIKLSIKYNIIKQVNPELKYTTRTNDEGEKKHVAYKLSYESLDEVINPDSEDGPITLGDTLTESDSLFSSQSEDYAYKNNHFIQWFKDNKEEILVESQLRFLADIESSQSVGGMSPEDLMDKHGPVGEFNRKLSRLGQRVEKRYKEEFPHLEEESIEDVPVKKYEEPEVRPIKVYDLETGEYIECREEKAPDGGSSTIILQLNTYGLADEGEDY